MVAPLFLRAINDALRGIPSKLECSSDIWGRTRIKAPMISAYSKPRARIYDDCAGLDPHQISRFYGVDRSRRRRPGLDNVEDVHEEDGDRDWVDIQQNPCDSQAGEPSMTSVPMDVDSSDSESEMDEEDRELADFLRQSDNFEAAEAETNVRDKPFKVPRNICPFNAERKQLFEAALHQYQEQDLLPIGYGVRQEEWGKDGYPSFEVIRSRRRGTKELRVALPDITWCPRAETWVQALHILTVLTQ
ncbi:hypothetical protein HGRIS_010488 [Hohenbuehelia grisea]|uniref:Uncharacterized protein n=1 Tax=Hohenbuehelia grisea TaxID=104357 RepID=A0ABR3IZA9_9AGAR